METVIGTPPQALQTDNIQNQNQFFQKFCFSACISCLDWSLRALVLKYFHLNILYVLKLLRTPKQFCLYSCIYLLTVTRLRNLKCEIFKMIHYLLKSVKFSHSVMSDSLWPHGLQHARLPCLSPTPGAYSNSCLLRPWYHPTISSSVIPFSSCLQSFPASGSFPMSQVAKIFVDSASASGLPMNTQDWSPLGLPGWISLQSKWLSRIFSNTTVQKHHFFSAQFSL